jgi:hypothetical protein
MACGKKAARRRSERAQAEKRRGIKGNEEAGRKVFQAEVAWPARTMRVSRERSFNNPDLPFIREVMEEVEMEVGRGRHGGEERREEERRRVLMMGREGEHRDRAQQPYIIT